MRGIVKQYPLVRAIDGADFTVEQGEIHSLPGENGAGKSTLLRLLAGAEEPDGGTVRLDPGVRMEYLPQNPVFQGERTVLEQVLLGLNDADRSLAEYEARTILNRLGVSRFEQSVGHLSGGERQRVAIARAMMKNAPIVILDEATSYTDPENEAVLQDAIGRLTRGKTLIVIAHRLSTITDADQIAVVERGKILDAGTHDELLKRCPLYAQMWAAHTQAKDADMREGGGKHV